MAQEAGGFLQGFETFFLALGASHERHVDVSMTQISAGLHIGDGSEIQARVCHLPL